MTEAVEGGNRPPLRRMKMGKVKKLVHRLDDECWMCQGYPYCKDYCGLTFPWRSGINIRPRGVPVC